MVAVRAVTRGTRRAPTRPRTHSRSTPAPVKGWNAKDSVSEMADDEAITLDNWFPNTSYVELRRGYASHATGLGQPVESLMAYASGSANKLFGAADSKIYEVTSSGAVGSADVSSLTNDRWQHVNFGTAAGQFLVCCNGADAVRNYDGSSWTTPTIDDGSSSISTSLIHVNVFKQRLFFIPSGALKFWYFPVATIAGTASAFDLAPFCRLGGYLMAMGTWTRDGGDGLDDLAVFVTSKGEVLIFQGSDPSSASTWGKVGRYEIGAPIGRRCMIKVGGELIIVTVDGIAPLSRLIATGRTTEDVVLTDKIEGAFKDAVRDYGSTFGWQPILYPKGNMVLFNVPVVAQTTFHQYVANTTTGAWCRFKGWNANCFEVFNDELYFGGSGAVYKADTGLDDDGSNIEGFATPAYSYLGHRGRQKKLSLVRPIFITDGTLTPALNANTDFETRLPVGAPTFEAGAGAEWDVAVWDEAEWGSAGTPTTRWIGVNGIGFAATINLKVATNANTVKWSSTDWLFEMGAYL